MLPLNTFRKQKPHLPIVDHLVVHQEQCPRYHKTVRFYSFIHIRDPIKIKSIIKEKDIKMRLTLYFFSTFFIAFPKIIIIP